MNNNIYFKTRDINSFDELIEFYKEHQNSNWVYRGHTEAKWGLKTSLDRFFENNKINDTYKKIRAEKNLTREFKRRYNQYSQYVPEISNDIEWLSLMQHYGAPTRLLDFTYSIFIGAYFALEEAYLSNDRNHRLENDVEDKCAIWAINSKWAKDVTIEELKMQNYNEKKIESFEKFLTNDPKLLQKDYLEKESNEKKGRENEAIHPFDACREIIFNNPKIPFVCPVNTIILNERLTSQKGLFMCPSLLDKSFEYNLSQLKNHDDEKNVIKIMIPKKERLEFLAFLFDMNISRTTLFPDLEGFAKTLGIYHPTASIELDLL